MLKWLGRIGLALLFALLFGLAIGTVLRLQMERPVTYIGDVGERPPAPSADPGSVRDRIGTGAAIVFAANQERGEAWRRIS